MRSAQTNILKQKIGVTVANNVIGSLTICRPVLQVMLSEIMANVRRTGGGGGVFWFKKKKGM